MIGVALTTQLVKIVCHEMQRRSSRTDDRNVEKGQGPHRAVELMMMMMMIMVVVVVEETGYRGYSRSSRYVRVYNIFFGSELNISSP
jgi:hypothetical protein